jgi:uncharacterized membrane protein YesL
MLNGTRAFLRGLNDVRRQGYVYIWANLAFVACSLPLVTAPAAYAALYKVAHQAQTEPYGADLDLFWETFKRHLWTALPWGLAMAAGLFVIVTNMVGYANVPGVLVQALRMTWLLALAAWSGLLLFTWPMYYEMAEPTVWSATRNAFVLMLRHPAFTLILILFVLVLSVVSTLTIVAWALLSCAAVAAVGTSAVLDRLAVYRAGRRSDALHT